MASYESHFSPWTRPENQPSLSQRSSSARLPTRSTTPVLSQSQIPIPHAVQKLAKKKIIKSNEHALASDLPHTQRSAATQFIKAEEAQRVGTPNAASSQTHSASGALPSSLPQPSSSRFARHDVSLVTRTPSLVSGSSVSTMDSPRSNPLRRKPSPIEKHVVRSRAESNCSQENLRLSDPAPGVYNDAFEESILGITLPSASAAYVDKGKAPDREGTHYLDFETSHDLATQDLSPPTPLYALSASPSTKYSGSSGPFSNASTPTSMSSHSPEIVFAAKPGTRLKQPNPSSIRSPVIRRKTAQSSSTLEPPRQSSVQESSNSSSSGSTVKVDESGRQKDRTEKTQLPAPPPGPPLHKLVVQPDTQKSMSVTPLKPSSSPEHTRSRPIQTPPELAHLMRIPSASLTTSQRPARPSREGVEGSNEIMRLRQTSPIIQSNLTSLPSAHHRRQTLSDSTRGGVSGLFHSTKSKLALPIKVPSRNPSPNPSLTTAFSPVSSLPPTRKPTPDILNEDDQRLRKDLSPTAASPSKSTSRFGFFTRRAKTEPTPSAAPAEKKPRKGPMAGTGHEGYGRYAIRGRTGSIISGSGSVGRSASAGSTTSSTGLSTSSRKSSTASPAGPDMDDLLRERLTPVAIRGEAVTHPGFSRLAEASCGSGNAQLEKTVDPEAGTKSHGRLFLLHAPELRKPVLLPSPMSESVRSLFPTKRPLIGQRTLSDEGASAIAAPLPTLAARRSFRRSQYTDDPLSIKVPTPIDTIGVQASPSIGSSITEQQAAGTDLNTSRLGDISDGKEGNRFKSKRRGTRPKAQTKPSRKWNFFQRAQAPSPTRDHYVEEVPVSVVKQPLARSVPHYAVMEMNDTVDMEDLEKIMQEADNTTDDQSGPEQHFVSHEHRSATKPSHGHSVLLPSPPSFPTSFVRSQRPVSPEVVHKHEKSTHHSRHDSTDSYQVPSQYDVLPSADPSPTVAPDSGLSSSRPSRLAQIGRIPQVVSKRDRDRKLSDQSFSRPFAPSRPRPTVQLPSYADTNRESLGSPESSQPLHAGASGSVAPLAPFSFNTGDDSAVADANLVQTNASDAFANAEFFSFPPRKNSELSYSSSSGIVSFPVSTAIVPAASAPQSEDEVWNEYDDLIDDVLSPKTPISAGSSQGAPFHYTNLAIGHSQPNQRSSRFSSIGNAIQRPHTASNPVDLSAAGAGARALSRQDLNFPPTLSAQGTPHTPMSFTDFFAGYGERNLNVVDVINNRMSVPTTSRIGPASGRLSLPASVRPTSDIRQPDSTPSLPKPKVQRRVSNRYRDTHLIEMAEKNSNGFESMANLRFGALMTSKWLSFGRVLFSPAHFELKNLAEDRVLILDGLGKDWSYYCALTYPNASVYNLGPTASDTNTTGARDSSSFQSLPNHRHIHHQFIASPFPFPRGFFAAVVFRFPIATSEAALRCAVFECKRVLRPGGYLELSVLDIDMLNMGNRARRAVRALKLQMQAADPSVSLKPISDTMQRLLGRRGFENLNRCIVGVPAAGRIPGSRDEGQTSEEKELSFSDLLKDQSKEGDEGITKMVAKVGRWWYSRCYETLVLPHRDLSKSIWADETLRKECEKRQTSFRLLICYAQKPMVVMRRTVSV